MYEEEFATPPHWFPGLHKLVRRRIRHARRKGDLGRAKRISERYAQLRPGDSHAWWIWGHLLWGQGELSEAERVLRQGLKKHANDPELVWLLSRVLASAERIDEAEQVLLSCQQAHSKSRMPPLGLISVAVKRRQWSQALSYAEDSLRRTPSDNYGAFFEVGLRIVSIPGGREWGEALLRRAAVGLPAYPPVHVLLGVLLEGREPKTAAAEFLQAQAHWKVAVPFEQFLKRTRDEFAQARAYAEGSDDASY